jgi:hypothetical protein
MSSSTYVKEKEDIDCAENDELDVEAAGDSLALEDFRRRFKEASNNEERASSALTLKKTQNDLPRSKSQKVSR